VKNAKAGNPGHQTPEVIIHLSPATNIWYQAAYSFEQNASQKWSWLPAFAKCTGIIIFS
jgi:hypothetical protein